jgi:hypothetical protein
VNLLIALFNRKFEDVDKRSIQVWYVLLHRSAKRFNKYPALVPPLSALSYLLDFMCWACMLCTRNRACNFGWPWDTEQPNHKEQYDNIREWEQYQVRF